jgi:hypothetical protein
MHLCRQIFRFVIQEINLQEFDCRRTQEKCMCNNFFHFYSQVSSVKHEVNFLVEMNSLVLRIAEPVVPVTVISDWNTTQFVIKELVNVIVR